MRFAGVGVFGLLAAAPVHATLEGLTVERRDELLPIHVANAEDLRGALAALDEAMGSHARTLIDYEVRVDLHPEPDGRCRIGAPDTRVLVRVKRPVLAEEPEPSGFVRRTWAPIGRALDVHEEGHVAIGMAEVADHHRRVQAAAARTFKDCRSARRWLEREAWRAEIRQNLAHDRYDRRTAFGAHQGAVLRLEPPRLK